MILIRKGSGVLWPRLAVGLALSAILAILPLSRPGSVVGQESPDDNPRVQMMRRMMRGLVPPPGVIPQTLPVPESEGARLLVRYCGQCHDLPSPRYKTANQWPAVFERMSARMQMMSRGGMMGRGRIEAPGAGEARSLLAYLQRHGMQPARAEELQVGAPADRAKFTVICAGCHVLPSPSLHPPEEWPSVVTRMMGNMQLMNRPQMTESQREAVVRFLTTAARPRMN